MTAASWLREGAAQRLLVLDAARAEIEDAHLRDLPRFLRAGDLLVVNDAATLPASLRGRDPQGAPLELRILGRPRDDGTWDGALLGDGDWRTRTEERPAPPAVHAGALLAFAAGLQARVIEVDAGTPRRLRIAFDREGAELWQALYAAGAPVQYAHVARPFALWNVQTPYAARPWASELPSAGRALAWEQLLALRRSGVGLARVTHAAGVSSTGDPALDAALPLPERYEIPRETARAVEDTRARGGRVVAVGTSTVRSLEDAAIRGAAGRGPERIATGAATAELLIDGGHALRACDGILTGIHEAGTSHARLLEAFAGPDLVARSQQHAEQAGYLGHELGDSCLILRTRPWPSRRPRPLG